MVNKLVGVLLLLGLSTLSILAQSHSPALHSSQDQRQVIEAVVRYVILHEKGIVFLKVMPLDPSQELMQSLKDFHDRLLPASRAETNGGNAIFDVDVASVYKDKFTGKEGLLLGIRSLEWKKDRCVGVKGGFDGASGTFTVVLDSKNIWKVQSFWSERYSAWRELRDVETCS
jgi:hypothetical protein